MINFTCKCDNCPVFCAEDNYDSYLCEGCDPYCEDYDYDDEEGDDEDE